MARLIDADALKAKAHADPDSGEGFVWVQDIDEAPAVDAVFVVHGRWELHGDDDSLSGSYFCSECGYCMCEEEYLDQFSSFRYCPNCGATMDLEVKDV